MQYTSKTALIYVTTLSSANTWTQILTKAQATGARGVKVKSRMTYSASGNPTHVPRPFDLATVASPNETGTVTDGTGFFSNNGSGAGDSYGPMSGLWARSPIAGCVMEVMVFA